ncbi:hypothetical protein ACIA2T_24765 [Amycolatopsis japonica]|uniref:hypothetical protein n=1 Tax=Amycolatopsis japonica TaxID=208439 RepID=UPI0037A4920B
MIANLTSFGQTVVARYVQRFGECSAVEVDRGFDKFGVGLDGGSATVAAETTVIARTTAAGHQTAERTT